MSDSHGWVGFLADGNGRPLEAGNDHLPADQRAELTRKADDQTRARGAHQAIVVVNVYENGEAVPQVQFPNDSKIDMRAREQVNAVVALAAEALRNWR